jgi:hypothetical protein
MAAGPNIGPGRTIMYPSLPLNEMTIADKLAVMELIWEDLSRTADDLPMPTWHGEVLAQRQREIDEGKAEFLPLDEFRRSIEKDIR